MRVSGKSQVDGFGLKIQLDMIEVWAAANGHELVGVCEDGGISGTIEALDRPGFACAVEALAECDGIVMANLSRLGRTLAVQEAGLSLLWRAGAHVFCADQGEVPQEDPEDAIRTLVRQIMGAVNQYERSTITVRMRKGREAKAAAGGYAGGRPGYGKVADNKALADAPDELVVVGWIEEMRRDGITLKQIADLLNGADVLTRAGNAWHPEGVRRVINRKG